MNFVSRSGWADVELLLLIQSSHGWFWPVNEQSRLLYDLATIPDVVNDAVHIF